jgi:hypothetical protein
MGKRIRLSMLGVVLCLASTISGQGYDPGVPDTLTFGGATVGVGVSVPLEISIFNDSLVWALDMVLVLTTPDSGAINLDSVRYVGRIADPSILPQHIVNKKRMNGVYPDTLLIALLREIGDPLPAGAGAVMELYFTGVHPGQVTISSGCLSNGVCVDFLNNVSDEYVPVVLPGIVDVVPSTIPPTIILPDNLPLVGVSADQVEFAVAAQSPPGFPTELTLSSMTGWDDPSILPLAVPDLDSTGQFSWTPGLSDVGIWRVSLVAIDSSGMMTEADVQIQIVSSSDYLLNLEVAETPEVPLTNGLAHGDFNNDGNWELLVSAVSTPNSSAFAVYNYTSGGALNRVSQWGPDSYIHDMAVGYVNGDDYLDAVLFRDSYLRVLSGGPDSLAYVDLAKPRTPSQRDGILADFNGDAHLDYVCASLEGALVYLGGDNATFSDPVWFIEGDSVLSINTADFNDDGFDDLALGTTTGLQVLLSDGQGGFVEGEFYPQDFGTVDLEVTTRGADFNGDMHFDLCLASPSKGGQYSDLYVYLGDSDGTFEPVLVRRVLGQVLAARPGDFNGDAILDIAYVNGSFGYAAIVFGDGDGGFTNELRFAVPDYTPRRLDCLDLDLDGDMDIIVGSYTQGLTTSSSLFVYMNQSNPERVSQKYFEVQAANSVDIDLQSPSGARLNRVSNTIASGELYLRDADHNDRLDIKATCRTIESGRYDLIATPRKNAPNGALFSLEYTVGEQRFRLTDDVPSTTRYVFPLYPDGVSSVSPVQGSFVQSPTLVFTWPNNGETRFELARDLNFTQVVHTATVAGGSYTLTSALPETDSTPYFWRVRSDDYSGDNVVYVFNAVASPTGVDGNGGDQALPDSYRLAQNYPNPFNPETSVSYAVPYAAHIRITVHNVLGQLVAVLVDQVQPAGNYTVTWDASDSQGRSVASGVYFYRMQSEKFSATRKMVLLR